MLKEILCQLVYPNLYLIAGLGLIIFIDLITGICKATKNGEATTSRGMRNSYDKATTYFSLLSAVLVVANCIALAHIKEELNWLPYGLNTLVMSCIYVELKSILENLIEINTVGGKKNYSAKVILTPIHNALILKFTKR